MRSLPTLRVFSTALVTSLLLVGIGVGPARAATEPHGVWPLRPRPEVVRPFDAPETTWGSGHRGVDLRGTLGRPVRTALPGRVTFVGVIAGVSLVVVDHGDRRTTYQPVAATVRVGDEVAAGDVIGSLQWFGSHCLPAVCLHWGLIEGDRYLDPLMLVGGPRPVRLLPLSGAAPLLRPSPAYSGWHAMTMPLLGP